MKKLKKKITSLPEDLLARKAISIIRMLDEDRNRYKFLWETDSTQAREIINELEKENQELVQALKYINASDSALISSKKARETLKKLGKL